MVEFITTAGNWVPIGPRGDLGSNIGEQCNGRIASIQIHDGTGKLYVGASSGGIWVTPPGWPPVWTDLGKNLPHPSVGALAVHPAYWDDILVGTGDSGRENDAAGGFSGGSGLFHTIDGGGHWAKVLPSVLLNIGPPTTFYRILYKPDSTDVILAASSSGLFRSENGANGPWVQVLSNCSATDLVFDPASPSTAYVCLVGGGPSGGGIYKSVDGGQNWTLIFQMTPAARGAIAICRHSPNVLVSLWESGANKVSAIIKSTNNGTNWSNVPATPIIGAAADFATLAIAIAPNDANQIYIGGTGLWWTLDNGNAWESSSPLAISHHADITQLYFSPQDDFTLWICNDGGVYNYLLGDDVSVSFNGDSINGLQVSQIYRIAARRNLRFAAMQDDGINGSVDGGSSWKSFHQDSYLVDGADVVITADNDQNPSFWFIYGISHGGYPVARGSYTNGSLLTITNPIPIPPASPMTGLFYDRFTDRVFVATTATQVQSYPSSANGPNDGQSETFAPAGVEGITGSYLDGQTLYLWVKNFRAVPTANKFNLLVLRRSGPIWNVSQLLIGTAGETNVVTQMLASRHWPGEAWAVLNGATNDAKVFHSVDYGASWSDISGDLTGQDVGGVNTIAASPFNSKEIYIGTGKGGVFQSLDGGTHWQSFQNGLPLVSIRDMVYLVDESHSDTDRLVIGTYGRGMYERPLDRPGPVYVDQRHVFFPWNGTIEFPFPSLNLGTNATPPGGYLLLNGSVAYSDRGTLRKPMTISSYEFPALIGR